MSFNNGNNQKKAEQYAIIKGVITLMIFALLLILFVTLIIIYNVWERLRNNINIFLGPSFYLSVTTLFILIPILFTPFSYGLSKYFIDIAEHKQVKIQNIFFLFGRPALLLKAMGVQGLRIILLNLRRFLVVLLSAVIEVAIFFISLVIAGENIFLLEGEILKASAEFVVQNKLLSFIMIVQWSFVIVFMLLLKMNFIFCKFALIRFHKLSVIEAIRIGMYAVKGNVRKTMRFYFINLLVYLLTFLNILPWAERLRRLNNNINFSLYALEMVEKARESYYSKRSNRASLPN